MSTDKIFGSWNSMPVGYKDNLTDLWHLLASQNAGTPEEKPNSGLTQRRCEITMLWELYKRASPRVVVEIGSSQGGSMAAWCRLGHPNATIISIDRCIDDSWPRPGNPVNPEIYNGELKMAQAGGGVYHLKCHQQDVHAINGWSYEEQTINHLKAILRGREIDWLFADSSHQADKFAMEFPLYWPLIAEGGVYSTHDIQESKHPDVTKWKEWMKLKETLDYSACFEFLGGRHDDSYGIGVFIK